jgi:hypothetical protein
MEGSDHESGTEAHQIESHYAPVADQSRMNRRRHPSP